MSLDPLETNAEILTLMKRLLALDGLAIEPAQVGESLAPYKQVPAFLRALLVTDGTVTMALEAYFLEPIRINTLRQGFLALPSDLPALTMKSGARVLFREVELRGASSGRLYAHASSLINPEVIKLPVFERLVDEHEGIGVVLRNIAKGSFREVLQISEGGIIIDAAMCRSYRVSLDMQPAILITEEFPRAAYYKSAQGN